MTGMADIHCHILPYVDDGAEDKDESMRLLKAQFKQGVRIVCCTPHLRKDMFETPDDQIIEQFGRLQERAEIFRGKLDLYLSREYFCDASFIRRLEAGRIIPMGNGDYVLAEFSRRYNQNQFFEFIQMISQNGYRPLVAHVERYPNMQDLKSIERLIRLGAKIQVNAGSILGREGMKQALWARKLIKEGLVHVVATDAHDSETRPPELEKASLFVERKYGEEKAKKLFRTNQIEILNI